MSTICGRSSRLAILCANGTKESGSSLRRIFLQKLQYRDLLAPERGGGMLAARFFRRRSGRERRGEALEIGAHESGVNVVLAAHGARVAEALGHGVDRADHVALGFALALRRPQQEQLPRREHRACPGSEVLRRDVPAGDLAKIGVHVVRRDGLTLAGGVDVFEKLVPWQILALLDDAREAPVGDRHRVIDPALAAEAEAHFCALDLDVPSAQRGEPEGAVLARVLVVAHADEGLVEQHHHGGEDLAPGEIPRAQIAFHALADFGEDFAELEHAAELRLVARLAVQGVVAVLLAAAGVARGRLDMTIGIRGDPALRPGGRNHQGVDSLAPCLARDTPAPPPLKTPPLPRPLPPDTSAPT